MARVRQIPRRIRQRIAERRNRIDLNALDDMLLPLPPEEEGEGIWRLQRKFKKDNYTNAIIPYMTWQNVQENQATIPEYYADPVLREKMRAKEKLREELIEDPMAEERARRERERGMWNAEEEKKLCAALAQKRHNFGKASKKMPGKTREDCVEHWYSYKKDKEHIATCDPCIQRQTDKRKRKRAATSSLTSPTHAQQKELDIEDGASPRKRSRVGRAILVPRRFRDEPEGRQH